MRAVVKSHGDLKGIKAFAFGCSVRNLKNFFTIYRSPCKNPFVVKLQPGIAYKKAKVKANWATLSKRDYTDTLTQILSCTFWKNYEQDFEHLCETVSEIMSRKEFDI